MDLFKPECIITLAFEPEKRKEFNIWLRQDDVLPFLEKDSKDENIIIFANLPHVFINTIFIPNNKTDQAMTDDLLMWDINPYQTWSYASSSKDVWVESPLESSFSKTVQKGEQILYIRSFEGDSSRSNYYEIDQKLSQIIDVHFIKERNAWCSLDNLGNILDIVKIFDLPNLQKNEKGTIVTANTSFLGRYSTIQQYTLCRMFDFTRFGSGSFNGWSNDTKTKEFGNGVNIFGKLAIETSNGSYSRGIQLIDISLPKEQIINNVWGRTSEKKKYESFLAQDWKNNVISEISCNPNSLANYFTESELPFEITPAFFNPEVLLKYKSDSEKYDLDNRSVSCRGSWHLETFDINKAGQVHTYLIYLSRLPYEEQLHWKQYNEEPKGPISKRALMTDIKGEFYDYYDPLQNLKHKLQRLHKSNVNWWRLRGERTLKKTHYPYTSSIDEWADELMNLDQLVVEGFEEKWLRKKSEELGRKPSKKIRSLKLLEECLIGFGFDQDHAYELISPFHIVHNHRSLLKGHATGNEAKDLRNKALEEYGSFRNHYKQLCSECDESFGILIEEFSQIKYDEVI